MGHVWPTGRSLLHFNDNFTLREFKGQRSHREWLSPLIHPMIPMNASLVISVQRNLLFLDTSPKLLSHNMMFFGFFFSVQTCYHFTVVLRSKGCVFVWPELLHKIIFPTCRTVQCSNEVHSSNPDSLAESSLGKHVHAQPFVVFCWMLVYFLFIYHPVTHDGRPVRIND